MVLKEAERRVEPLPQEQNGTITVGRNVFVWGDLCVENKAKHLWQVLYVLGMQAHGYEVRPRATSWRSGSDTIHFVRTTVKKVLAANQTH